MNGIYDMVLSIAYGFDLDNTFLRTEKLKWDMGRLCHARFPQISSRLFQETYFNYRLQHYGRVHMREILELLADHARLSPEERGFLVHDWMGTLPYGEYVFHGTRDLISGLGKERVFLITKSPDQAYQEAKIRTCNLPLLDDGDHIWITEAKTQDVFGEWVGMMKDRGITHLVYGSDEAQELVWAHEEALSLGLGFDGVHHQYGAIWRSGMDEARQRLGEHYHKAVNFHQFAKVVRGLHGTLEGSHQTVEWGRGGAERR